jgi:hypothetical protein
MTDFSHFDLTIDFSAEEGAALIVGDDPLQLGYVRSASEHVFQRMEHSYIARKKWLLRASDEDVCWSDFGVSDASQLLESVDMCWHSLPGKGTDLCMWLMNPDLSAFRSQKFSRIEMSRWLKTFALTSKYEFLLGTQPDHPDQASILDLDPVDLPEELDLANIVYRAVTKGYGKSNTFKKKVLEYFDEHYPQLNAEARKRISILVNADKTAGRPKSGEK